VKIVYNARIVSDVNVSITSDVRISASNDNIESRFTRASIVSNTNTVSNASILSQVNIVSNVSDVSYVSICIGAFKYPGDYANDSTKEFNRVPPHHFTRGRVREEVSNPPFHPANN